MGTVREKVDNTTAIVFIEAEEISRTKVLNASQAIQVHAGVQSMVSSDLPGEYPSVKQ
jgi:hypothetical protein